VWWIQSVYILPDYRKIGVFRSIFEQIKLLAKESNACGLRLYVDKDNIIAKKAYKNLGMEESHYDLYEMMLE
jgi:predicted GNAT family acetyltransferase